MDFLLREWKEFDADNIAFVADNIKIAANLRNVFPHPYSISDAEEYIAECIMNEGKEQLVRVIDIDGKAFGSIGIFKKGDVYEKSAELGYWLAEEYWGKGIMTEAVKRICREAFEKFDITRIFAEPFDYNTGSRRVLEKAGFTYEGTMRNGVYKNGRIHSYCMYSLLKEEMPGNKI